MQKVVCIEKLVGETPLQAIEKYKLLHPELDNQKLAYAGRLDPMAEGLLLILVGEECKNRKTYERLAKTYEFEVLFGLETDTYDLLGLFPGQTSLSLNNSRKKTGQTWDELDQPRSGTLKQLLKSFIGVFNQPYPPFSSPRVNGKPLFYWAREGKLNQITIPTKQVEIYSLELLYPIEITTEKVAEIAVDRISQVKGEFRQRQIIHQWVEFAENDPGQTLFGARFKITCSSGTYVRSIAHEMGKKLGTGATAFSIKRTKIGDYSLPSHSA